MRLLTSHRPTLAGSPGQWGQCRTLLLQEELAMQLSWAEDDDSAPPLASRNAASNQKARKL